MRLSKFTKQIKQTAPAELTVHTPRISVHYIYPSSSISLQRFSWQAFFSSIPVIAALIIGVGLGSVIVWQSKFGNAETDGETNEVTVAGTSSDPEDQWSKPLNFDPSELNVASNLVTILVEENRHEPSPEEIKNAERKDKLTKYFKSKKSPFGKSEETVQAFLDSKNMRTMVAISFVESTMGQRCYYNNCSGIGGYPPTLRKYKNHSEWVRDFDSLLERRYKGVPIEKFMGLYVQPGSPNWINGVKQILGELKKQGIE